MLGALDAIAVIAVILNVFVATCRLTVWVLLVVLLAVATTVGIDPRTQVIPALAVTVVVAHTDRNLRTVIAVAAIL